MKIILNKFQFNRLISESENNSDENSKIKEKLDSDLKIFTDELTELKNKLVKAPKSSEEEKKIKKEIKSKEKDIEEIKERIDKVTEVYNQKEKLYADLKIVANELTELEDRLDNAPKPSEEENIISKEIVLKVKDKKEIEAAIDKVESYKKTLDDFLKQKAKENDGEEAKYAEDDGYNPTKKELYDLVMNDPLLKKSFYYQPKLFGKFLNFGKAMGLGPALKLLNNYVDGYDDNIDLSKFIKNEIVTFEVMGKPVKLGDTQLDVDEKYKAKYIKNGLLKSKEIDGVIFNIKINNNVDDEEYGDNTYSGNVTLFNDKNEPISKKNDITIKIINYKAS
jgi:hypothetical protein